jgi:hypothetical protein
MRKSVLIVFSALALISVLWVIRGSMRQKTAADSDTGELQVVNGASPNNRQEGDSKRDSIVASSVEQGRLDVATFDPSLVETNPVYVARIRKHLDLRYYRTSPAKDSAECKMIVELLKNEGVGLEAVGDAYNATWDLHAAIAATGNAENGASSKVFASMIEGPAKERLRNKYGITNEAFFEHLFEIRPRVFFGHMNRSMKPGETLFD